MANDKNIIHLPIGSDLEGNGTYDFSAEWLHAAWADMNATAQKYGYADADEFNRHMAEIREQDYDVFEEVLNQNSFEAMIETLIARGYLPSKYRQNALDKGIDL
jgi:sugar phosphate isomerase/epimerase